MNSGRRCVSVISDTDVTVTCALAQGHGEDHGCGFLRWDETGYWYTQRWRTPEGTWHGLPDVEDGEE